jgi:holo-[acyl-carrier protein] synthase
MIGIDICSAARIRRVHERHGARFTDRVFTQSEIAHAMRMRDPWPHLAARWAAKEAVFKVLGRVPGFRFRDVEVVSDDEGKPRVRLTGASDAAARGMGLGKWHCSITHEGDTAACVVLALPGEAGR